MKGKSRIIYLCAALFALTVIGGLLHATPALAWETWPTADNNDPNHIWTVVFDQAMNIATINDENIYVSDDITGSSRVSGVSVRASDNTHALVIPLTGGWNTDTNYYLIITQKVLTSAGMPLKDEVRMPFRIVVKTRETLTIDVINDGSNITIKVNGNQLTCDQPPYIANGRTMVPFRAIAEALGAEVEWEPAGQKITIMGDKTVELTVNSTTARVNGASVTLDNPAVIAGGRTMVPLRFVGEALGAEVNYTSLSQKPNSSPLSEVVIRDLFSKRLNEDKHQYNLDYILWQGGCFTKTDSIEAIVHFYDRNQCHGAGYHEIWLLRYENDWVLDRKIADCDNVSFMVVDIEKDGKQEVWIEQSGGNMGYTRMEGKLFSISPGTQSVLYSNEGFNNAPALIEGEAVCKHDVDFQDIDNDGVLEIIDRETKEYYSLTGGSRYPVKTSSVINKSTYKMTNGYYLQINN